MSHNELEELMICVCDYYHTTKQKLFTNNNSHGSSKAKKIFVHIARKYDLMDPYRLAFFMDTNVNHIYTHTVDATNRMLYDREFREECNEVEKKFLNKELSIY